MVRAALNRLAGPMLLFLGLSTIGASALLVPVLSARRAGQGVKRTPLDISAADDDVTMVLCLPCLSNSCVVHCWALAFLVVLPRLFMV